MALTTPRGFAGGPMADFDYGVGAAGGAWVETAAALAVTQPNGATRSVAIAAGTACAYGVRESNDAVISQALAAPSSGGAWYLIALRFNWSAKTVTLQVLPGPTTGATTTPTAIPAALPATMSSTPGTTFDLPLAWVFTASDTTTLTLFDLRMRTQLNEPIASTTTALAVAALQSPLPVGMLIPSISDGITYRWNGTAWKPWDSDWVSPGNPATTNFTLNTSATNVYRWRYRGGKVMVQYFLTAAAFTAGNVTIALPVASDQTSGDTVLGNLWAYNGASRFSFVAELFSATTFGMRYVSNTAGVVLPVTNTAPTTWGAGHNFYGSLEYDPA